MKVYRRDIDGLRAFAVMGVILHHAVGARVGSGYAGVDIFFVISGFLIGGIIADEMAAGSFSWRRFYARRALRILPTLFFVILITLAVGWFTMTPNQLRYFGGGAISTLFFMSNIWFYNRIDYFNPEAAEDPLIHTWSLAVEEQFYIVLPVLMFLLWRFRPRMRNAVLMLLALSSFGTTVATGTDAPMAIFYLIHARAWELLAGVFAALWFAPAQAVGNVGRVLADLGLILIVLALFIVPVSAVWPGPWTFLPVCGAVLLMLYGHQKSLARWVLSLLPIAGLGLISYSAYLWHQPVLGFLAIIDRKPSDYMEIGLAVIIILGLAALSWRFVEQPFRQGLAAHPKARLTLWAGALAIAGFAVGGHVSKGYETRVPTDVREVLSWTKSVPDTYRLCIGGRKEGQRLDPKAACVHGVEGLAPSLAIWGDSHAAVLAAPLGQAITENGLSIRELSASSCPPISSVRLTALKRPKYCPVHNRLMLNHMVNDPDLRLVVIFSYWNSYVESRDFDNRAGVLVRDLLVAVPLDEPDDMPDAQRIVALTELMRADLRLLVAAGKQVVLVLPIPEPGFNLPDRLARDLWMGVDPARHSSIPEAAFADYAAAAQYMLESASMGLPGVTVYDPAPLFCTKGADCKLVRDGKPLYFDKNHLSLEGSALVAPPLATIVLELISSN